MRLLLDENIAVGLETTLQNEGRSVDHAKSLNLQGASDPELFKYAIERNYDALVTQDLYRRPVVRVAVLKAMLAGLRIVRLRFSRNTPGTAGRQLQSLRGSLPAIEEAAAQGSTTRLLIIRVSGDDLRQIVRTTVEEVEQQLRQRGAGERIGPVSPPLRAP